MMDSKKLTLACSLTANLLIAATSAAQVSELRVTRVPIPAGVLDGFIAHDLHIDFAGEYSGSQMIVSLTSGSIYQNTDEIIPGVPAAGDTPPAAGAFGSFPAAEFDTFVAMGGPVSAETLGGAAGVSTGAGAVSLGGDPRKQFDTEGINQAWNAAPGNMAATDITNMLSARVTLSNDANGTLMYVAAAGGTIGVAQAFGAFGLAESVVDSGGSSEVSIPIVNGVIGTIPEPSTFMLLGIGLIGMIALKHGNGKLPHVSRRADNSLLQNV